MKVSEVIKMLETNYNPDEEIVALWWDKECVGNLGETEVSDEAMAYADEQLGESELTLERIGDIIAVAIEQYEKDKKESN